MKVQTLLLVLLFGLLEGERSFVFLGPGYHSEVLSLPLGSSAPCDLSIEQFPDDELGGVAFLLGDVITVCGEWSSRCFSLHPFLGIWEEIISPLPWIIFHASATTLANGDPIILGGAGLGDSWDFDPEYSSVVYHQDTGEWTSGPALPDHLMYTCTVKINTTHSVMLGGDIFDPSDSSIMTTTAGVYIFDGNFFTSVSSMKEARAAAGCSLTSDGNIIVAGGFVTEEGGTSRPLDSVEIYNPVTNTWVEGPQLPKPRAFFAGMINDEDKILLFGGLGLDDEFSSDIYSLKNGEAEWNLEDTKLAEGMATGPQALKIKSDSLNC